MSEKEGFREIILAVVREEIESVALESEQLIRDIVRAELLPGLRSAIRETVSKELENVVFGYKMEDEDEKQKSLEKNVSSRLEEMTSEGVVEPVREEERQGLGLYLYGIVDTEVQMKLGEIGVEGNDVYTIPHKGLSAIVHNCPLEPYKTDDEEVVKGWVKTHQHVLDIAENRFGTVMPFSFDVIIKPESNANAEEALKKWISEEFDSLMERMNRIRGKKEYAVQVFYTPSVMTEQIVEETEEIRKIKEEMESKSPGVVYMYKQKLENTIKKEMESKMDSYFKDFYRKIGNHAEEINVDKTKKSDEKDKQMVINLSCLVSDDKYKELASELDEIDKTDAFSVRFIGPFPPYSFV